MKVQALKSLGWTLDEIGEELGYHPATISNWIRNGGPPTTRKVAESERVIDEKFGTRIAELIAPPSRLLATSVYEIISAEGFGGSYPTVVRRVRDLRGPRFRPAPQVSVPIETAPGEESQFDFSDCSARGRGWGLSDTLWCFGAVACWSRYLFWWFTTSVDREHTFEGLVRHYEDLGGVPHRSRTDRMGALGTSQGRRFALHPPTVEFAVHHGTEIKACQAGDAKRKGKIERPFRGLEASFLEELAVLGPPASIDELNERSRLWLAQRGERPGALDHQGRSGRSSGDRTPVPRSTAAPTLRHFLPRAAPGARGRALDRVGGRALLGVPPECLGQMVGCRVEVDSGVLEISWGGAVVGTHTLIGKGSDDVWDPAHRQAAEEAALGRTRAPLRLVAGRQQPRPARLFADYDIEAPDLAARYGDAGEVSL